MTITRCYCSLLAGGATSHPEQFIHQRTAPAQMAESVKVATEAGAKVTTTVTAEAEATAEAPAEPGTVAVEVPVSPRLDQIARVSQIMGAVTNQARLSSSARGWASRRRDGARALRLVLITPRRSSSLLIAPHRPAFPSRCVRVASAR